MKVFVEYPNGRRMVRELACNVPASYVDKNTWEEDEAPEIITWALESSEHKMKHGIESMSIEKYWKAKRYLDVYSNIDWLMWEAIHIDGIDMETAFEIKEKIENQIAKDRELTTEDLKLIFIKLILTFGKIFKQKNNV